MRAWLRACAHAPSQGLQLQIPARLVPDSALLEAIENWVLGHASWPLVSHRQISGHPRRSSQSCVGCDSMMSDRPMLHCSTFAIIVHL